MKTTLNKIRAKSPCESGWKKLLRAKGKTEADDEEFSLLDVLESNGLEDAIWCLRAVDWFDKEKRLFAVWCARQVQHLMKDQRSIAALDVAERFANGEATQDELHTAYAACADADAAAAAYAAAAAAANDAYYAAADDYDAYAAAADAAYAEKEKQKQEFIRMVLSVQN